MASAFRCYTACCELRRIPPSPVLDEAIPRWGSVFNDTPTFGNYVCLLERCCFSPGFPPPGKPPAWPTWLGASGNARIAASDSLISLGSPSPGNYRSRFLWQRIRTGGILLLILFPLGAPSETLMLRRAYASGPLDTFSPQPDKALMAVRFVGGEPFLFTKFSWRKNLPSGCILRRPCFCNLTNRKAALIFPVHVFWQLIRCRVDTGKPIFSAVNRRNFNRIPKVVLAKLRIPEADRYSSHAFRRGISQELKESGPPLVCCRLFWSVALSCLPLICGSIP